MGQQQLLLLVLGIVIVGIAVVAGIQAFSEGKDKADRDAVTSDAMRVASDLQAWKLKPAAFGGGAGASGYTGVTFASIGLTGGSIVSNHYQTSSSCIQLTAGANATLTLKRRTAGATCSAPGATVATVTISGTGQDDISWAYSSGT